MALQDYSSRSRIMQEGNEDEEQGISCSNNAPYVQNPETGHFFCDCSNVISEDSFAGARCEFVATSYCDGSTLEDPTFPLFCTNQGSCIILDEVAGVAECSCSEDWYGPRCEYPMIPEAPPGMGTLHETVDVLAELENEQPRNNKTAASSSGYEMEAHERGGALLFMVVIFVAIAVFFAVLARSYIKRKRQTHERVAACTTDLQMEDEEDELRFGETRQIS